MSPRTTMLTCLLAFSLSATALPATPVDLPAASAAWLARDAPAGPIDPAAVARPLLLMTPLGDLNGDGLADMLLQQFDAQGSLQVSAAAGPDLQEILWTLPADLAGPVVAGADLDADGILDPVILLAQQSTEQVGQGLGGVAAAQASATGTLSFLPISGATGEVLLRATIDTSTDLVGAGVLEAGVAQVQSVTGAVQPVAQGALRTVETQVQEVQATLLDVLLQTATVAEVDVVIKFLDAAGTVVATIDLSDPAINPVDLAAPDLDLDGQADALVALVQKATQVEENQLVQPIIQAYDAAGALLWEQTLDAAMVVPMLLPRLGEALGPGQSVVGVVQVVRDAQGQVTGSVLTILDAADGLTVATQATAGVLLSAVPFGAVDASAGAEILLVAEDLATGALDVSLASADLETLWTASLTGVPINQVLDPFTQEITGFLDVSGDAVADVLVAADGSLALLDGLSGDVVWDASFQAILDAAAIADLAGPVGAAVVDLAADGTATLTVLQGATGLGVFRLPLLQGATGADVSAAGDLDGDGVQDIMVRVEVSAEADAAGPDVSADGMAQSFLVSGATGEVLYAHSDREGTPAEPGAVVPLEAYAASAGKAGEKVPLAPWLMLVALVVALRRRR